VASVMIWTSVRQPREQLFALSPTRSSCAPERVNRLKALREQHGGRRRQQARVPCSLPPLCGRVGFPVLSDRTKRHLNYRLIRHRPNLNNSG
jgi:hypothetical protein